MRNRLLIIFALVTVLSACKKDNATPNLGLNYYPTEVGHWVVWDVDSIVHYHNDLGGGQDTFRYQVRELIESDFTDNEGRLSQRIERSKRLNSDSTWVIHDAWFATRTQYRLEKVEENIRSVKLTFPVKLNERWDGNAFNILDEWEYRYTEVDIPATVGAQSFDSTCTVLQREDANLVFVQNAWEKYARNVGMIAKDSVWSKPLTGEGLEFYMRISSWGRQ